MEDYLDNLGDTNQQLFSDDEGGEGNSDDEDDPA